MQKVLKSTLAMIIVFFLLMPSSPFAAAGSPTVNLDISPGNLEAGTIFDVKVNLTDFVNVNGFQVVLNYDSSILEPQVEKAELDSILKDLKQFEYVEAINQVGNGKVEFAASLFNSATPFTGSDILINIPFKLLEKKDFSITFDVDDTIFTQVDKPGQNFKGIQLFNYTFNISKGGGSEPAPMPMPPVLEKPELTTPVDPNPADDGNKPGEEKPTSPVKIESVKDFKDQGNIGAFALNAVDRLVKLNVISGNELGQFNPKLNMTRDEFAKVIVLATGLETTSTKSSFPDVSNTSWSKEFIMTAVEHGLIKGKVVNGKTVFAPKDQITRAEIATILVRALNLEKKNITIKEPTTFKDIEGSFAKEAIQIAYQEGLVRGRTATEFAPNDNATREEVAVFVVRLLDNK